MSRLTDRLYMTSIGLTGLQNLKQTIGFAYLFYIFIRVIKPQNGT